MKFYSRIQEKKNVEIISGIWWVGTVFNKFFKWAFWERGWHIGEISSKPLMRLKIIFCCFSNCDDVRGKKLNLEKIFNDLEINEAITCVLM